MPTITLPYLLKWHVKEATVPPERLVPSPQSELLGAKKAKAYAAVAMSWHRYVDRHRSAQPPAQGATGPSASPARLLSA